MTASDAPRRLVVRLPNWLGDVMMALPALSSVRQAFPDVFLALAATSSIAPVFEEQTPVRPQQLITVDKATEAASLREGSFDTILLLTSSFRSAWIARRSGIPNRWGYAAGARGVFLTKAVPRPRKVHQSEFYLRLAEGLGMGVGSPKGLRYTSGDTPPLTPSEGTRLRTLRLFEQLDIAPGTPLVGFAPGAAYGHAKRWPPDRVARVITRLWQERGIRAVLVGAGGDREAGRAIESSVPPDVNMVNLIGRTDLRLLMGVIHACRAFVSNDSGAMHLAAALGVPVTAIFGPTNERATAPLGDHDVLLHPVFCRPCMLRECPIDHRCMTRISEEDVYGALTRRMDRHV
ncbi:MAG: lipopolysaccharide heptosyltransferase II [Vicinamibacterales bacterium]